MTLAPLSEGVFMTHVVHPILLAGGSGTRLWPLSRKSYPKQFAELMGEMSLFQASAKRLSGEGFAPPIVRPGQIFDLWRPNSWRL